MNILKQSTAATIKLGPFVDDTDGKTAETGLTISQADIRLSKNGGDMAQTNNSAGATHDELGYYNVPLDTTDTGTLGRLRVAVSESGALPVWQDFLVVTANVYDTLCSTDNLDVNVTALADDVITAAKFDESTAYPLKSADTGATAVARVGADSDTLETLSDEIAAVKAETAAILVDTGTTLDGNITAILADTNEVQAELADGGRTDLLIDAIKAKTDNLPASPAPANEYDAELAMLQADLDNADQYKADVSGLATTIHVQEVENKVDLIDVTTVANSGKIDAVDTKVSAIDTDTIMSFMIDGFTFEQIVQIMASVLAGKLTRSGDTLTFRDLADTVNRVVAETDANKQRTTMTYTV